MAAAELIACRRLSRSRPQRHADRGEKEKKGPGKDAGDRQASRTKAGLLFLILLPAQLSSAQQRTGEKLDRVGEEREIKRRKMAFLSSNGCAQNVQGTEQMRLCASCFRHCHCHCSCSRYGRCYLLLATCNPCPAAVLMSVGSQVVGATWLLLRFLECRHVQPLGATSVCVGTF